MVGSRHTRRLAAIVLASACIFATSGCYVGRSTVGPDNAYLMCPAGVDFGPGKISSGGDTSYLSLWQPAPTAVNIQFAVMSSDATQPISVDAGSTSFGVVWDGTHSTGTKTIRWSGAPFVLHVQTRNLAHMDWWIEALDATGKEVGFTACMPIYLWGGW
jgi:hypothetical protein